MCLEARFRLKKASTQNFTRMGHPVKKTHNFSEEIHHPDIITMYRKKTNARKYACTQINTSYTDLPIKLVGTLCGKQIRRLFIELLYF